MTYKILPCVVAREMDLVCVGLRRQCPVEWRMLVVLTDKNNFLRFANKAFARGLWFEGKCSVHRRACCGIALLASVALIA